MTTLADVARKAGVSTGLVSRVLNNRIVKPIPDSTIKRIKQAAIELDYSPNVLARALITGRTHTIGLCYSTVTDPHFTLMLQAVEARVRACGYHIIVTSDAEDIIIGGRVDGVLAVSPFSARFAPLEARGKAVVYIDAYGIARPNTIFWDDVAGARMAAQHLLGLGHRHIAALFEDVEQSPRVIGFRMAMQESDATCYECLEQPSKDQIESGYLLTRKLLEQGPPVTAIFGRNDFLAVGAMRALYEARFAIPEEVSVIGYSDTVLTRSVYPPLTSIHTPFAEAGVMALERLLQAIEEGPAKFEGIQLPVTLTERASCAPPPARRR